MKPMIIVPPEILDEESITLLRENGICVVISKDPSKVRFVDPIPAASSRTEIENTAIKLTRLLLHGQTGVDCVNRERGNIAMLYAQALVEGTPLGRNGTPEEQEKKVYDSARHEEIQKMAREDARAERAKKKAELAATQKK